MHSSPRILLVEDDPDHAELFGAVLTLAGYTVTAVPDADHALRCMSETFHHLVLVDWDLPDIKGDVFIILVKAQCPGVKIALISNFPDVDAAALLCRADAWMRKAEGPDRLRALVHDLVGAGLAAPLASRPIRAPRPVAD